MKVSVVIPAFNAERYLEEAIISVDYPDAEVIVVDDGSTDSTSEIAKKLNCQLVVQRNSGLATARNNGASTAKGDVLIFLDSDDCFIPHSIEGMIDKFESNRIVRGKAIEFYSSDLPIEEQKKIGIKKEPFYGLITGCLIPTELFKKLGGFDVGVKAGEAVEFTLKAKDSGVEIFDSELSVIRRRIHSSNFGRKYKAEEFKNYLKILKSRMAKNGR